MLNIPSILYQDLETLSNREFCKSYAEVLALEKHSGFDVCSEIFKTPLMWRCWLVIAIYNDIPLCTVNISLCPKSLAFYLKFSS